MSQEYELSTHEKQQEFDKKRNYPLLELIKYRDAGMNTYTYFWVENSKTVSPYFDSEKEAHEWNHNRGSRMNKIVGDCY